MDVLSMKRAARRRWMKQCSLLPLAAALQGLRPGPAEAARAAAPAPGPATLLVLGDSLSAEYGIARGKGWVALMGQRLASDGLARITVVNASISGETTSGGRSRLAALLTQHRPAWVVVELGANDALRGLPLTMTQDNLAAITRSCRAAGAKVVLIGMQLPPNYGRRYTEDFAALYAQVAKVEGASLVPFMFKGVADVPHAESYFQPDRIHPLASAHPIILGNIWPVLRPLLPAR
jgi:acyl-CoA thioesterase I